MARSRQCCGRYSFGRQIDSPGKGDAYGNVGAEAVCRRKGLRRCISADGDGMREGTAVHGFAPARSPPAAALRRRVRRVRRPVRSAPAGYRRERAIDQGDSRGPRSSGAPPASTALSPRRRRSTPASHRRSPTRSDDAYGTILPNWLRRLDLTIPDFARRRLWTASSVVAFSTRRAKHLPVYRNVMSSALRKNIFLSVNRTEVMISEASPAPTRGTFGHSSRDVGRDAMDALARRRCASMRTAKPCGPDAPTLASSSRRRFARATVAKKPGHRGEHEVSRKTIAQGSAGVFRRTCGDSACVLFHFAREAAGAARTRHSLRPCVLEICQNVRTGGCSEPPVAGTEPVAPKGDESL